MRAQKQRGQNVGEESRVKEAWKGGHQTAGLGSRAKVRLSSADAATRTLINSNGTFRKQPVDPAFPPPPRLSQAAIPRSPAALCHLLSPSPTLPCQTFYAANLLFSLRLTLQSLCRAGWCRSDPPHIHRGPDSSSKIQRAFVYNLPFTVLIHAQPSGMCKVIIKRR